MQTGQRIYARRRQMNLTLKTVSEASGLSIAYLSRLERQQANPTVTALSGVAQALGVKLSFFVPDEIHNAIVVRVNAAAPLHPAELPSLFRSLASRGEALQFEPLLIQIEPDFTSAPSNHLGEEFLHVLSGRLAWCFTLVMNASSLNIATAPSTSVLRLTPGPIRTARKSRCSPGSPNPACSRRRPYGKTVAQPRSPLS